MNKERVAREMLRVKGKYIHATMHDCKNNFSKLLSMMHDADTPYEAVVIERYGKVHGMLFPYKPHKASGVGPIEEA